MKSLNIQWRLWLAIGVGWLLIGLAYAANYWQYATHYMKIFGLVDLPPNLQTPSLPEMLIWELPYWFLWASLAPLVFWLTQRFRLEHGRLLRNALINLAACIALTLFHRAVYLPLEWLFGVRAYAAEPLFAVYQENFLFNLPNGFLCYVTILIAGTYYRHYEEEELKISRLKTEVTQAQLRALKMQLQPHFLFNTLNSISDLLDEDAEAAEKMLARLGDFLRLTLNNSGAEEVTLQEELDFLSCYLEIERVRFPDRLRVQIDATEETYEALVPNFILQPLVENAIKHGFMANAGAGLIEIRARRDHAWLCLEVQDNGPGLPDNGATPTPPRGLGLKLTRERLASLYQTRQRLHLANAPEGGLQVQLEIPFRLTTLKTVTT